MKLDNKVIEEVARNDPSRIELHLTHQASNDLLFDLASVVSANTVLRAVRIEPSCLTVRQASVIAEALAHSCVRRISITRQGRHPPERGVVEVLLTKLATNGGLRKIAVAFVDLTEEAWKSLKDLARFNPLTHVALTLLPPSEHADWLLEELRQTSTLHKVDLKYMPAPIVNGFLRTMKGSRNLRSVSLSLNSPDSPFTPASQGFDTEALRSFLGQTELDYFSLEGSVSPRMISPMDNQAGLCFNTEEQHVSITKLELQHVSSPLMEAFLTGLTQRDLDVRSLTIGVTAPVLFSPDSTRYDMRLIQGFLRQHVIREFQLLGPLSVARLRPAIEALRESRSLVTVRFQQCGFDDEDVVALVTAAEAGQWRELEVSNGRLRCPHATLLADLIRRSSLRRLNLSGNLIREQGAEALFVSLEQAPLMEELDLSRNIVGESGLLALALALPGMSLRKLGLSWISDNSVKNLPQLLAKGFQQNTSLLEVEVTQAYIGNGKELVPELNFYLERNRLLPLMSAMPNAIWPKVLEGLSPSARFYVIQSQLPVFVDNTNGSVGALEQEVPMETLHESLQRLPAFMYLPWNQPEIKDSSRHYETLPTHSQVTCFTSKALLI